MKRKVTNFICLKNVCGVIIIPFILGKIDNKVRVELIKEEEKKIKEEREERKEEKKKLELEKEKEKEREEILVDKAPIISATSTPVLEDTALRISTEKVKKPEERKEEPLQSKDFEIIEKAIDTVSKEQRLIGKCLVIKFVFFLLKSICHICWR